MSDHFSGPRAIAGPAGGVAMGGITQDYCRRVIIWRRAHRAAIRTLMGSAKYCGLIRHHGCRLSAVPV